MTEPAAPPADGWDAFDLDAAPPVVDYVLPLDDVIDAEVVEDAPAPPSGASLTDHRAAARAWRNRDDAVRLDLVTLPERFENAGREALLDYRDRDAVTALVQDVRERLLTAVRATYGEHLDARKATVAERNKGPEVTTSTDVAAELRFLADAENVLGGLADSFAAGKAEARTIAGDVILDVEPDRELGTASVRVGLPGGATLKATRSQATKVDARTDDVVDVLVARLVGQYAAPSASAGRDAAAYAQGAREGIAALLALTSAPSWKSTALDALARELEGAGEDSLAIRLGHAYGRVATGNPSTKLEVVEPKPAKAAR